MEPLTSILGGALIATVAGSIGKFIGGNGKMSETHCDEKRSSCQALLIEKIDAVDQKISDLVKVVNNKLLGL